ncbi:MAG: LTA synthase family protein [Brumimicrobium sp.]|nr:LTA synthase family protein [Brumimicrobium sp.]
MKEKVFHHIAVFLKGLLNRWTILALLFALYSVVLNWIQPGILHFSYKIFVLSVLLSIAFWNAIGGIIGILPKFIAWILVACIAFLLPALFTVGTKSFFEFKTFLDSNLLVFSDFDPHYFTTVIKIHFNNKVNLSLHLLVSSIFFFLLVFKEKYRKNNFIAVIIFMTTWGVAQNQFGKKGIENFTTMDSRYVFSYKKYKNERGQILEDRKILGLSYYRLGANAGENNEYNIVLIVHESMSLEPISIFGYKNNFMPFLQNWYNKEKENFVLFHDAMAISGCTDMSMPTMLTGTEPEADYYKFMRMPFMWDYAKENGYTTGFITPQQFGWFSFYEFYKNKNLDFVYSAEDTELEYANDLGIDDVAQSINARKVMKDKLTGKRFFMVWGSNALHYPYQGNSDYVKIPSQITDHYGRSLYIVDKAMNNMYDVLKELGQEENTIYIFTADHGQYTSERLSRLGSFYLEALQIPMFIKFPKKWIADHPEEFKAIKANTDKRVTNLDLMPTFLDLLGSTQSNELLASEMHGTSLFKPIDNHRTIVCLSTNEFRIWSNEGLGIYQDSMSYIIDNVFKEQLYNLNKDRKQFDNLIGKTSNTVFLEYVNELIKDNKELTRIYDTYVK